MRIAVALSALLLAPLAVHAHVPIEHKNPRRATAAQLTVEVERRVLANGLVVVLSPDAAATTVVVQHILRAGAVFEPGGHHGMAHLVEHVMFRGVTPDTDYEVLLRQRGAIETAAFTSRYTMRFDTVVPPAELPLALWVAADRMAELPRHLDAVDLAAHKRIVLAERNERSVDREYGLVDELIDQHTFAANHPLHDGIGGTPDSIDPVTIADIRDFVARHFVPANSVLVVTGRFDPRAAGELIDAYFGRIPGGQRAAAPALPPPKLSGTVLVKESLSREPRVTMAWLIAGQRREVIEVLDQGAALLSLSVDGAFGTRIAADVDDYGPEALFRMDVTLPYDKPKESALGEADAFLRYLTMVDMDVELMAATNLHRDRQLLFGLDAMRTRALVLGNLELAALDVVQSGKALERHWKIDAPTIQEVARKLLKNNRVVVHAQPERPRQPRREREDEQ